VLGVREIGQTEGILLPAGRYPGAGVPTPRAYKTIDGYAERFWDLRSSWVG